MLAIRLLLLGAAMFCLSPVAGQSESTAPDAASQEIASNPSDDDSKPATSNEGLTPGSQRTQQAIDDETIPRKNTATSSGSAARKPSAVSSESALSNGDEESGEQLDEPKTPQVFGWIEEVMLAPGKGWRLNAKLDTGADTSSLDARNIRRVTSKGKRYVRFDVKHPTTSKLVSLRRPFVRTTRIRRHSGKSQRRQVVLMSICLGDQQRIVEVTLTDREVFDYPLLLGRSALAGLAVVNPIQSYTAEPTCWGSPEVEDAVDPDQSDSEALKQQGDSDGDDQEPSGDQPEQSDEAKPVKNDSSTPSPGEPVSPETPDSGQPVEQTDAAENLTLSRASMTGKRHALS